MTKTSQGLIAITRIFVKITLCMYKIITIHVVRSIFPQWYGVLSQISADFMLFYTIIKLETQICSSIARFLTDLFFLKLRFNYIPK